MTESPTRQGIAATLAHELIGPISSTGHSLELVLQHLQHLLPAGEIAFLQSGLNSSLIPAITLPEIPANLPPLLHRRYRSALSKNPDFLHLASPLSPDTLDRALRLFEIGFGFKCASLGVSSAQNIIANLKGISAIENGKKPDVDLLDTLHQAHLILAERLRHSEIRWQTSPLPLITANRDALLQVWINIFNNAAQINPQGCLIDITTTLDSNKAKITISNTGEPLPEGIDIFAPGVSRRQGGSGIGLDLCQQIVRVHGGTISAQRRDAAGGASFNIVLPIS
jgi:signal transduction histidine kinase